MAITATRNTILRPNGGDQDSDGFVDFGDVLRHTITITNTGPGAVTGINVDDSLNGSTLNGTVNISPIAFDDTYTAIGNTLLEVGNVAGVTGPQSSVAGSVLANDVEFGGDSFTISSLGGTALVGGTATAASANGTVTLLADGSFTYISNAGFTGTDSFTYTVTDDGLDGIAGNADDLSSTATVSITVTGQVWYVDANAAPGGTGTSTNPFSTVTAAGTASGANDYVHVTGAATGAITLDAGEQLYGTGSTLTVGGFQLTTGGANSSINAGGAGFTVTLGSNNTIAGIDIDNTGGGSLTGTGFGTLTVNGATLDASGQALSLNTGSIAGTGFTSTDSDGGANNVNLQSVTGTLNLGGGALSGATSNAVVINGGNGSVDYNGSVTHTANGHAIQVINKTGGSVDFDGAVNSNTNSDGVFLSTNAGATINFDGGLAINTSASNTTGFQATTGGTVNVTGAGNSIVSGTGTGLDLNGVIVGQTGVTFNLVGTQNAANGIVINNVSQAAGSTGVDVLGGLIANAGTRGIDVNATSADLSFGSTITTAASGRSVEVTNAGGVGSSSTINFSGAIDENGLGINLDNNDQSAGSTITFSGALDIDSANGQFGFNATNGGTVNVTGAANSIVTNGNFGLNVVGTNIGAGDLNFQSISTTGGTSGIVLNNTGNVGGLTVTGDAGSAINSSGGTISGTSGPGINLSNTRDIVLDQMTIQNNGDDGVRGNTVTNYSLSNSTISGNGDALQEHGVEFSNVNGNVVFNNVDFLNNETSQLSFINTSGTVDVAITDSSFQSTGLAAALNGLHGVHFETQGSASGDIRVVGSAFNNLFSNSIHTTNEGTGILEVTVQTSTFNNIGASAINIAQNNSGAVRFLIDNNPTFLRGSNTGASQTININQAGGAPAGAVLSGQISNNTIGNNSAMDSANQAADGIRVLSVGSGTTTVQINNNNIQGVGGNGINVQMSEDGNAAHTMNATIFNNTVNLTNPNSFDGIRVVAGATSGPPTDAGILRLDMHDNNAAATAAGNDFTVRSRFGTTMQVLNYAGGALDVVALQTYFDVARGNNATGAGNDWFLNPTQTGSYVNTGSVPAPTLPSAGFGLEVTPPPVGDTPTAPPAIDPNGSVSGPQGDLAPTGGGDAGPIVVDDGVLSQAELDLIVDAAIDRWAAAGATAEQIATMRAAAVTVADLAGANVGASEAGKITIDTNAGGFSWYIDATPGDDSEYGGSGSVRTAAPQTQAGTRVDLLTTVMHELGHQIGLGDTFDTGQADELMFGAITIGQRRLPGADDAAAGTGAPTGSSGLLLTAGTIASLPAGRTVIIQWDSTVNPWGAGLAPTLLNFGTITGSGGLNQNTNTETLSGGSAPLALDTLTLGGTVWNDNGAGGGTRADGALNGTEPGVSGVTVSLFIDNGNIPGGWDALDSLVTTTTTGAGGAYSFTGLGPGDYIVRVDQSNFGGLGALASLQGASGTASDPDNDVDGDNNGSRAPGDAAYSLAITLAYDSEPTADGTGKFDINTTLDFGFIAPNVAPSSTNLSGDTATWTEGDAAVAVDVGGNATIADSDSTNFDGGSLTIDITGGEVAAQDALSIAAVGGVTSNATTVSVGGVQIATYTGGSAGAPLVFTFDADATPAAVQALVRAIRYTNSGGEDPTDGDRTLTWTLVDGDGNLAGGNDTLTMTTTVDVDSVNDEPVGGDETIVVNEDDVHTFSLSDFNFSDTDGDSPLAVVITTAPGDGTLALNGTAITGVNTVVTAADIAAGLLTFAPDANENGAGYASFTFQVRDNGGTDNGAQNTDQTPNTMTIDVTALNDAPVNTVGATVNTTEDAVNVVLSDNVSPMSVSDVDAPGDISYSLHVSNGTLTIRTDVVGGIQASDIQAGSANGTATISIVATVAQINATLAASNGLLYTPTANFAGNDTLEVYVSDLGQTGLDTNPVSILDPMVDPDVGPLSEEDYDTRTIVVAAVDDAPVAGNDAVSAVENVAATGSVLGNDSDVDGPGLAVSAVNGVAGNVGVQITLASGALLTLNANGTYSYDPNGRFNYLVSSATAMTTLAVNDTATDSFTYTLAGGNTATVTVTVNGIDGVGDQLWGNSGNNTITGTAAGIVFNLGQGGDDTATGQGGNDGFYMGAELTALDSLDGGAGVLDQLGLQGDYGTPFVLGANHLVNIEMLVLLSGNDTRFGDTSGNSYSYNLETVDANVGAGEQLAVSFNTLQAGENVTFDGSDESDGWFLTYGGLGNDTLIGGDQSDRFYFGNNGRWGAGDSVDGGAGTMDQLGLQGSYTVAFGAGQLAGIEMLVLLTGGDTRFGNPAGTGYSYDVTMDDGNVASGEMFYVSANTLRAEVLGVSDETLVFDGSAESDGRFTIYSGAGDDTLTGGDQNDTIYGAGGADTMIGGLGNDTFAYMSAGHSTFAARDQILDFSLGDRIDLTAIDAIAGGANNSFTFIGASTFSNTAGELRAFDAGGGIWQVQADVDGNGLADLVIAVTPAAPLVTTDFLL